MKEVNELSGIIFKIYRYGDESSEARMSFPQNCISNLLVLINYLLSAFLNGTILVQILLWGSKKPAPVTSAKKRS
jgi:hypothetical protein